MYQKEESFSVPIIHNDLRQEETTVQIALALDDLNEAVNMVFNHINTLINDNKIRLSRLQKRSQVVKVKIEKLSGTNRATKVFSCTKYPASDVPKDYEYSFQYPAMLSTRNRPEIKINAPVITHPLKDKSKFFYIKRESNRMMVRKNIELTSTEGLGALPDDLECISSLLLFNTSENLYKDYVMSDPLHVFNKTRPALDGDERNEMEAAPKTMSVSDQSKYKGLDYSYTPVLQDMPEIDVPIDLPDLPGIAGDLRYSLENDSVIAPSLVVTPQLGELPNFVAMPSEESVLDAPQTVPLPPPPMPVPPPVPQVPPSQMIPPPPPPPPPSVPVLPLKVDDETLPDKKGTPVREVMSSSVNEGDDARANLMEAIRNAGGKATLKSAAHRKQEAKRIKEVEQNRGGNLMADLHLKLAMRRKGISGQREENVGETAIERMLLNANSSAKGSETEEDGEWDE